MRSTLRRANPAARASATARCDVGRVVRAAERGEHVRHHRLHAEAQPVHAGRAVDAELVGVDAVGIALDRDLGVRGSARSRRECAPAARPRAATASRRRRTRSSRTGSPRRAGARGRRRTRRRSRRSDARDRSTSRNRSSRSGAHRTGCGRRRRKPSAPWSRAFMRLRPPALHHAPLGEPRSAPTVCAWRPAYSRLAPA